MEEGKENSGMIFVILQKMTIYAKLQKKKNDPSKGIVFHYFGAMTMYRLGSLPSEWVSTLLESTKAVWITFRS